MKLLIALILSSFTLSSYGQIVGGDFQSNTITTAFPFLLFSPDAKSSGLGDAGVAFSPSANSLHWNVANLGFSENRAELTTSYSPWMRQLVEGVNLLFFSGYSKLGSTSRHSLGGSVRYLSDASKLSVLGLGNDLEILGGYALRVSDKSSIGANVKFLYSDLIKELSTDSLPMNSALGGALDLSYGFLNENIMLGQIKTSWAWGVSVSNLGNKSFYTNTTEEDFLPANFRIGSSLGVDITSKHRITATIDFNKLMIPNQFAYTSTNNISAIEGVFRSFVDSKDGFIGELKGVTIGSGVEYKFKDFFALRTGYFFERASVGNRRFVTLGAGVKFKNIGIDTSYLVSTTQNNPLANTVRLSLNYVFKS